MKFYEDGQEVTINDVRRAIGPTMLEELKRAGILTTHGTILECRAALTAVGVLPKKV